MFQEEPRKKRAYIKFTNEQVSRLLAEYEHNPRPDKAKLASLATEMDRLPISIQNWFRNHEKKEKKERMMQVDDSEDLSPASYLLAAVEEALAVENSKQQPTTLSEKRSTFFSSEQRVFVSRYELKNKN